IAGSGSCFEQSNIMFLDRTQMPEQHACESIAVGEAEEARESLKLRQVGRQRMCLLIRAHLQTVLDSPQELVSSSQFIACGSTYPATSRQRRQRRHRAGVAE